MCIRDRLIEGPDGVAELGVGSFGGFRFGFDFNRAEVLRDDGDVLHHRLAAQDVYKRQVEIRMQQLPFEQLRWIQNDPDTYVLRDLDLTSDTKAVEDLSLIHI